jgi:hypothetical protein
MQADNNILLFGQWFRNKQSNSSHASTQPAADAALKTPQARPLLRVTERALCCFFSFFPRQHPARGRRCAQDAACASAPSCHTARSAAFYLFIFYFLLLPTLLQRRRKCLQLAFLLIYLLVLPTLGPAHMTAQARSAGSLPPGC